ncbi:MAG: hypothetical protein BMS9Abin19_1030 [Gammaproteobacteria bacterium]|nr:MAG: hypothetical protein BMS9Abin19_1030 [Gammaproteobacteria bacterium]
MRIYQWRYFRYFLLTNIFLFVLTGCGYQRPAGKSVLVDATEIYFSGVELDDEAIDPNYKAVCNEARDEIKTQLIKRLPAKIAPLALNTTEKPADTSTTTVTLKLRITRCEIDAEQSQGGGGGSFAYYLTLPVKVSVTQDDESLLTYNMNTYEQVQIDEPSPEFEFTFEEPVARTLLLFNGKQLWVTDN